VEVIKCQFDFLFQGNVSVKKLYFAFVLFLEFILLKFRFKKICHSQCLRDIDCGMIPKWIVI